eukprot:6203157-Pleurochrysis_carterae.AAC.1
MELVVDKIVADGVPSVSPPVLDGCAISTPPPPDSSPRLSTIRLPLEISGARLTRSPIVKRKTLKPTAVERVKRQHQLLFAEAGTERNRAHGSAHSDVQHAQQALGDLTFNCPDL